MAPSFYTSQRITSQIATDSGRPTSKPKAKLRLGRTALDLLESIRFIVAALLTMGNDLPFSDRKDQRSRKILQPSGAAGRGWTRGRNGKHVRVGLRSPAALRLILLALSPNPARRAEAMGIIQLGDGRLNAVRTATPRWAMRLALIALSFTARASFAQEVDVATPMTLLDPVQGDGVRIGSSLVLHPEVSAAFRYDSNIYNLSAPKRGDAVFDLQPRLTLSTDLPRHRVDLFAAADVRRYAKYSGENSEAGELGIRALLELAGHIDVRPSFVLVRGIEQRGTSGDQFLSDKPVSLNRKEYGIEIAREQRRLELLLSAKLSQTDYDDAAISGVPIVLSQRNVIDRLASARLAYNLGSRIQVYSRFQLSSLSYRDPAARQLNSSGYDILAGGRIRVTNQIDLDTGVGMIHRSFDNSAFKNLNAVNFALTASWTPRPTWQLIAGAERRVDPSPLFNSPAIFRTSFKLEAKHLVTPKLLIGVRTGLTREEYRAIARVDRRFAIDGSALYRLTPNIGITLDAGYRKQDGGLSGRTFSGLAAGIGVKVVG
ncbi:outer membrane beta-barrel protein [Novosphingobium aquiterrae]|uniref:Outer membrane beta-barrel protein n=1 Tax=Novosphingobium aquiterrae TaxID=624388 RepID=A0ABV6PEH1_9SPHN